MFESVKQFQKEVIEKNNVVEYWVKDEIINVLDIQISQLPILDQQQYTILINSAEHPNGYKLDLTAHPTLRIRNGLLVRDSGGNPDSFFWDDKTYQKNKGKSNYYLIGTDTGAYLENLINLYNRIVNKEDAKQLLYKVASRRGCLEVMEMPAVQRRGVEVTESTLWNSPTLLESYNDWNEKDQVKLNVGDLLVLDDSNGYYYRVEKSLKEQTYHKGTLAELFEVEVSYDCDQN